MAARVELHRQLTLLTSRGAVPFDITRLRERAITARRQAKDAEKRLEELDRVRAEELQKAGRWTEEEKLAFLKERGWDVR